MLLASKTHGPLTRPAAARSGSGVGVGRWLLCFVALCLTFQGLTLSVERARGRAHHHLDTARSADSIQTSAHGLSRHGDLDGHRYAPDLALNATGDPPTFTHLEDRREVDHSNVDHHDHDAAVDGVVYVAEDNGASALNPHPTLVRSVHDLDGWMPRFDVRTEAEVTPAWANGDTRPFESHVSGPLERPPRA